jgi:hypothetical protein
MSLSALSLFSSKNLMIILKDISVGSHPTPPSDLTFIISLNKQSALASKIQSFKMSYPTKPAYIVESCDGWEPKLCEHPVFDWMYDYEQGFDWGDIKSGPHTPWHTDDYTFTNPTGETISGGAAAWAASLERFAPLAGHYHEPRSFVIWETMNGYKLTGSAVIYGNLRVPGEKKHKDLKGREWDIAGPVAYDIECVKDPSGPKGLKVKAQKVCFNTLPLAAEMVKRGVVTTDQVFGQMG